MKDDDGDVGAGIKSYLATEDMVSLKGLSELRSNGVGSFHFELLMDHPVKGTDKLKSDNEVNLEGFEIEDVDLEWI